MGDAGILLFIPSSIFTCIQQKTPNILICIITKGLMCILIEITPKTKQDDQKKINLTNCPASVGSGRVKKNIFRVGSGRIKLFFGSGRVGLKNI